MFRASTALLFVLLSGLIMAGSAWADPVGFRHFSYESADAVFALPLPTGTYRNPIISGFHPDPSWCRVGDDYYLVNSSFIYYPGLPIFHSKDLVNWTQLGNAIDRPTQLNYDGVSVSQGLYAPAIAFHDGVFYLVCTMVGSHLSSGWSVNFLLTAKNPAGPWSDPKLLDFDGMDPGLFFDDDGRAYIVNNGQPAGGPQYPGHCAIWLQELDLKAKQMVGPRTMIVDGGDDLSKKPWYVEGPHLYKHHGHYYLFCAQGGTELNHSEVVFRSEKVTGPYRAGKQNPILTQRNLPATEPYSVVSAGHADVTIGPDGKEWAVFLGCRPYEKNFYITGRETFMLPMRWTSDDWPVILPAGERIPPVVASPRGARVIADAPAAVNGNFTWRADFRSEKLDPAWLMLRQPHETWWKIHDDALWLTPQRGSLSLVNQPAFLARRIQHARFKTTVELVPSRDGDVSTGLVAFQNEQHLYFLGVRNGANPQVFLEQQNGPGKARRLASMPLPKGATVQLQIEVKDSVLIARFSQDGRTWETLSDKADATLLTTQAAGGFVGAVVGAFARIDDDAASASRAFP